MAVEGVFPGLGGDVGLPSPWLPPCCLAPSLPPPAYLGLVQALVSDVEDLVEDVVDVRVLGSLHLPLHSVTVGGHF